jgi:hypothetical protein
VLRRSKTPDFAGVNCGRARSKNCPQAAAGRVRRGILSGGSSNPRNAAECGVSQRPGCGEGADRRSGFGVRYSGKGGKTLAMLLDQARVETSNRVRRVLFARPVSPQTRRVRLGSDAERAIACHCCEQDSRRKDDPVHSGLAGWDSRTENGPFGSSAKRIAAALGHERRIQHTNFPLNPERRIPNPERRSFPTTNPKPQTLTPRWERADSRTKIFARIPSAESRIPSADLSQIANRKSQIPAHTPLRNWRDQVRPSCSPCSEPLKCWSSSSMETRPLYFASLRARKMPDQRAVPWPGRQ